LNGYLENLNSQHGFQGEKKKKRREGETIINAKSKVMKPHTPPRNEGAAKKISLFPTCIPFFIKIIFCIY
jgi:hypothetical protein